MPMINPHFTNLSYLAEKLQRPSLFIYIVRPREYNPLGVDGFEDVTLYPSLLCLFILKKKKNLYSWGSL